MFFRAIQRGMAILCLCCFCPASLLADMAQEGKPCHVELRHHGDGFGLLCDDQPFFIQGAGGDASRQALKDAGANSLRLWGADHIDGTLAEANRLGLKVALGIWLEHGDGPENFSYHNPKQVAQQFERAKATILKYKDNPAVLVWGIGNEMEGPRGDDPVIWAAVQNIAHFAHQVDHNHPTMTVTAELGGQKVPSVNKYCPDIEIMGINSYAGAPSVAQRYRKLGGTKPFILTEFGPAGAWECGKTSWGAPIELTSTQKTEAYRAAYEKTVLAEKGKLCLGSYAFVWGNKQETTATWFGMFLADGSRLGSVDTMQELWTGKAPEHPCPKISSCKVDHNQVAPGEMVHADLDLPVTDGLSSNWVLTVDPAHYLTGGYHQDVAAECKGAIVTSDIRGAQIKMPEKAGGYLLYAYVHDSTGGAATAVTPLLVKDPSAGLHAKTGKLPRVIYGDGISDQPYAWSGWMGDTASIGVDPKCTDNPHSGQTCMKCQFKGTTGFGGVAGQSPANDWGDKPGGLNLTGAKRLSFWARSDDEGTTVSFKLGILGAEKKYGDSDHAELNDQQLTSGWKQYTIELSGKNLSCIKTGFVWVVASQGKPVTFYIDDIQYE